MKNYITILLAIIFGLSILIVLHEIEMERQELINQRLQTRIDNFNREETPIVEIDCNELREGDIRIIFKLYNPLGEWTEITTENVEYQLQYGGRIIQYEKKGGDCNERTEGS